MKFEDYKELQKHHLNDIVEIEVNLLGNDGVRAVGYSINITSDTIYLSDIKHEAISLAHFRTYKVNDITRYQILHCNPESISFNP